MYQLDLKDVVIILGNYRFLDLDPSDPFLLVANEPLLWNVDYTIGGMGYRFKTVDKGFTLTLNTPNISPDGKRHSEMIIADQISSQGNVGIMIKHVKGDLLLGSNQCFHKERPEIRYGTEMQYIPWTFHIGPASLYVGAGDLLSAGVIL